MTSGKMFPLLLRKTPPRKKQLFFAVLATLTLTMSVGEFLVGLVSNENHWYIQSFGLLCTGAGSLLAYRRSIKEEQEGLERESSNIE
jgi:hypothetical protein